MSPAPSCRCSWLSLRSLPGIVDEPLKPLLQVELLRFGLAATGELQDVLDDQVHPLRLVLDDLRQASVRGIQFL